MRLTIRLASLLAVVTAGAAAVAACTDATLEPAPSSTRVGRGAAPDSGRPATPPPTGTPAPPADTARRDSVVAAGPGTLSGMTVENYLLQWRDAAGVTRDSAGYRGIGGVAVTIHATTRPDSTSGTPPTERRVATATTDATGQFRTGALPDGWYTLRATWTVGGATRSASASAELLRGHQQPSIAFLNLR